MLSCGCDQGYGGSRDSYWHSGWDVYRFIHRGAVCWREECRQNQTEGQGVVQGRHVRSHWSFFKVGALDATGWETQTWHLSAFCSHRQWIQFLKLCWIWRIPSPPCFPVLPSTQASIRCFRTSKLRWEGRKGIPGVLVCVRTFTAVINLDILHIFTLSLVCFKWVSRKLAVSLSTFFNLCHQDLWLPYFNVTTDITASAMRVHQDGK